LPEAQTSASTNGTAPEAPCSLEAEEAVLGAMMITRAAVQKAATALEPGDFYRGSHGRIFEAALALHARAAPVDGLTLLNELEARGTLEEAGGKERLFTIANLVPASSNVQHYANIVLEKALLRGLIRVGQETARSGYEQTTTGSAALADAETALAALRARQEAKEDRRAIGGATWLEQATPGVPAVWGAGDVVLWAEGEPFMLYGPDGVGKTSICQQLVLHMCGVRLEPLLGLPVRRTERPILYVSADRPKQARRSLARMVDAGDYAALDEHLLVWEGPLPFAITDRPRALLDFVQRHGAGTLILDSLKDVTVDLSKEESAVRVAHAFQWLMAEGIDLCALHHPRKAPAGEPAKPKTFEDIYGNRLLHGAFGSGLLIWGNPGDLIVDLIHLKQPADEYGPKQALHDHAAGRTTLYEEVILADLLGRLPDGLTIDNAAAHLFRSDAPDTKQREKARRKLERMVKDQEAFRDDLPDGTARYKSR
jgi:replicative DNA helicase